jgi:hypothetical protein
MAEETKVPISGLLSDYASEIAYGADERLMNYQYRGKNVRY